MRRKIITAIIVALIGTSILLNYKSIMELKVKNNSLIQEVKKGSEELSNLTEKHNRIIQEMKKANEKLENEKEILNQQLENEKLQKTIAIQKASRTLSRGSIVSGGSFNNYSRVDVKTGITPEQLNKAFKGTKMEGIAAAFVQAENEYSVNAIFLASIAILESGWGNSSNARNKNNLFGFGSYDNDPSKTVVFSSKTDGVLKVAKALRRDYLNKDGIYFNGATPKGINVKYCTSSNWNYQITEIMNMIIGRIT